MSPQQRRAPPHMNVTHMPFDVLGVRPEAEPALIATAYKALVRKYHPDANPGLDSREANRLMAELNWAMAELERDLHGWREWASRRFLPRRALSHAGSSTSEWPPPNALAVRQLLEVTPHTIWLSERRPSAILTARASAASPQDVRVRFGSGLDVARLPADGDRSVFRVSLREAPADKLAIETLEVVAAGFSSRPVFVAIEQRRALAAHGAASADAWFSSRVASSDRYIFGLR